MSLLVKSTATGCAYQGLLPLSSLFWIPGLVYESILLALVAAAYRAWAPFRRELGAPLVRQLARDSLVYFVVCVGGTTKYDTNLKQTFSDSVFAEQLISTIIWARAPEYINIVNP